MRKLEIIILSTIISSLITYNMWHIIAIPYFFQKSESVFILLATTCIVESVKLTKYTRLTLFLSYTLFSFALNNVLDNLFFNPFAIEWNEYLFAFLALIVSFRLSLKHKTHAEI
jgi:hypothetical protein